MQSKTMPNKLTIQTVSHFISDLEGWRRVEGREAIHKKFVFKNFTEAFAWMVRVAEVANAMDHHPEWSNIYRTVDVTLSTHEAGGITQLDISMAARMNALVNEEDHS